MKKKRYPLVSIIVPHQQSRTDQYIKNYYNQSYPNFEIIVKSGHNINANKLRNEGAKLAKGEYLFFCDDDLILSKNCIKIMVKTLRGTPHSICYCNYNRIGLVNGIFKSQTWNIAKLIRGNYISAMSLIRAKGFCGWDESLNRLQDWDVWLTMASQNKTGIWIDKCLFTAVYDNTGISVKGQEDYQQSYNIITDKHKQFIHKLQQ